MGVIWYTHNVMVGLTNKVIIMMVMYYIEMECFWPSRAKLFKRLWVTGSSKIFTNYHIFFYHFFYISGSLTLSLAIIIICALNCVAPLLFSNITITIPNPLPNLTQLPPILHHFVCHLCVCLVCLPGLVPPFLKPSDIHRYNMQGELLWRGSWDDDGSCHCISGCWGLISLIINWTILNTYQRILHLSSSGR